MKPIRLTIAGLHSFREKQTIHFDELSDAGVFGIFGPTGSGKSTILDAITLALYGVVGRAHKGKQGILNHAEKSLEVSFQFQIGSGAEQRMYRVDRRYDRNKEFSVKIGYCRLVELDANGEVLVVLSEKDTEITQQIEDLLGLKHEDFTRAVVLPQGKFSEFLHLEGKKRREMLQRLFALERYGSNLTTRVNQRFTLTEKRYDEIIARQEGMGDCSKEAVEQAAQRLEEAKKQEQQAAEEYNSVKQAYERAKQIVGWQQELAEIKSKMAAHESAAAEIHELERRIQRSDQAEKVLPFVTRFEEAQEEERRLSTERERLEAAAAALRPETEQAFQLWEAAKQAQQTRSQELGKRQNQLEHALELERDTETLSAKISGVEQQHSQKKEELAACREQIQQLTEGQQEVQTEREVQKQILLDHQASQQFRALVHEASKKHDALSNLQRELVEAQADFSERSRQLEDLEKKLAAETEQLQQVTLKREEEERKFNELSESAPTTEESLSRQEIRLAECKMTVEQFRQKETENQEDAARLASLDQELAGLTAQLQQTEAQLKASREQLQSLRDRMQEALLQNRKAMAVKLAEELCEGEACPVCGSLEHPQPAKASDLDESSSDELDGLHASIQEAETQAQQLSEEESGLRSSIAAKEVQIQNLWQAIADKEQDMQKMVRELSEHLSIAEVSLSGEGSEAVLVTGGELLAAWEQERAKVALKRANFSKWQEELKTQELRLRELKENEVRLSATVEGTKQSIQTARLEKEKAELLAGKKEAACMQAQEELRKVLQKIGADTAEQALRDLNEKDEQASIAQKKLQSAEEELNRITAELAEANKRESQITADISSLESTFRELREQLRDKQEKLQQITDGQSAKELLEKVTVELKELEEREKTTRIAFEEKNSLLQDTERNLAQARALYERAVQSLESAKKDVERHLQDQNFATVGEVKDALLVAEERLNAFKRVQGYLELGASLRNEKEKLEKNLAGQSLSDEAWTEIQRQYETAQHSKEQAIGLRTVAQTQYEKLLNDHAIWEELEKEKTALAKQLGYLVQLKNLLKGERFVEFLAQEQLEYVAMQASERLKRLTRNRYALEVAEDGGFIMRDDANGGVKRPVTTLSGGETFLTSLSLALSLSGQIQLRGKYPLEFFFLDEGFGTLDQELLDVVMSTLEQLHLENMTIGVISHVPELQQRLHRRLIVEPAEAAGRGTRVRLERV